METAPHSIVRKAQARGLRAIMDLSELVTSAVVYCSAIPFIWVRSITDVRYSVSSKVLSTDQACRLIVDTAIQKQEGCNISLMTAVELRHNSQKNEFVSRVVKTRSEFHS